MKWDHNLSLWCLSLWLVKGEFNSTTTNTNGSPSVTSELTPEQRQEMVNSQRFHKKEAKELRAFMVQRQMRMERQVMEAINNNQQLPSSSSQEEKGQGTNSVIMTEARKGLADEIQEESDDSGVESIREPSTESVLDTSSQDTSEEASDETRSSEPSNDTSEKVQESDINSNVSTFKSGPTILDKVHFDKESSSNQETLENSPELITSTDGQSQSMSTDEDSMESESTEYDENPESKSSESDEGSKSESKSLESDERSESKLSEPDEVSKIKSAESDENSEVLSANSDRKMNSTVKYDNKRFVPYTAVQDKVVVGYYADWKARDMPPEKIPFDKLTHINYSFAIVKEQDDEIKLESEYLLPKVINLAHEKGVKVLLSVGGWTGSKFFSPIADDAGRRRKLVDRLVKLTQKFNLDGIDIDWEFPGRVGMACNLVNAKSDSTNFMAMLKELRTSMDSQFNKPNEAKKLITLAVRVQPIDGPTGPLPDVTDMVSSVDFINVMAYDINGSWGPTTGPNAPLRHKAGQATQLSYMSGIQDWLAAKFPSDKLVMGLAFYGRSFKLKNELKLKDSDSFYQPYQATIPQGDQEDAMWSDPCPGAVNTYSGVWQWKYLRSQSLLTSPLTPGPGWVRHYDPVTHTPWLYSPTTQVLINYDDPESLSHKVSLAKCYNLRGVMIWALHEDNLELLDSIQPIRSTQPASRTLCEAYSKLDSKERHRSLTLPNTTTRGTPANRSGFPKMAGIIRHAPKDRHYRLPLPDSIMSG